MMMMQGGEKTLARKSRFMFSARRLVHIGGGRLLPGVESEVYPQHRVTIFAPSARDHPFLFLFLIPFQASSFHQLEEERKRETCEEEKKKRKKKFEVGANRVATSHVVRYLIKKKKKTDECAPRE